MNRMDVQQVMAAAHLGLVRRVIQFTKGERNITFHVITGRGEYCLRVYREKTPREFGFELALLNDIRGLPAPRLHRFGSRWWTRIDGHYAVVYDYIPGNQRTKFTTRQLEDVGEFLGRFHRRTRVFWWSGTRKKYYDISDRRIERIVRLAQTRRVPFLEHLPYMAEELRKWRLNPRLPNGPIHVDVKPENVLFESGRLSGVIDFDNSYLGPLMLDLATSMVWFGLSGHTFDLAQAAAVYRGYRRKRRLTSLEYQELYRVLRFKFVSHVFIDYEMRAKKAVSEEYLAWLVNNLYRAYRHLAITEKQFYHAMPR